MSKTHLNWGILGAANFARTTMAPAINEARRNRLAAIATRSADKAAPFADIAPGLRVFDDYDALLADPDIDAVYIPLPNALHVPWSIKAAEAGKPVLCEKPIALTATDFEQLIAARDATGALITEGWMPAHHPQWHLVRDMIAGGDIGDVHTVSGSFSYGLADPANIRLSADLAGGALRDIGVYPIGAFRFATGLEPQVTHADAIIEHGVDTSLWVSARAGETRFRFHLSMRTQKRQEMVFEGTKGTLILPAPFNAGVVAQADVIVKRDGAQTRIHAFPDIRQYVLQVEAFAAHHLDGTPYPYTLENARGTQVVIDQVFEKLRQTR